MPAPANYHHEMCALIIAHDACDCGGPEFIARLQQKVRDLTAERRSTLVPFGRAVTSDNPIFTRLLCSAQTPAWMTFTLPHTLNRIEQETRDMKVYWSDPQHDDHVREGIQQAMRLAETDDRFATWGIGVIDFADCTVVTLSRRIPQGEVFTMVRRDENSILHGGFGDNPFPVTKEIDFTDSLVEVRNPDAPKIFTTGKT